MTDIHLKLNPDLEQTPYGFRWYQATVERTASVGTKRGHYLSIAVRTPRAWVDIMVTPSGLIRPGNVIRIKKKVR